MLIPIGSMYAIYGNMDPINIPPMLAYIPAPWILWGYGKFLDLSSTSQGISRPSSISEATRPFFAASKLGRTQRRYSVVLGGSPHLVSGP